MKVSTYTVFFLFFSISFYVSAQNEEYTLFIDDVPFPIQEDKDYNVKINGKQVLIKLVKKDTLTYRDDFYSFKYHKDFKVAKTEIDSGIEQIVVMTADGSGFIIQKYMSLNPTFLNEMMLNEITKESVSYGYTMNKNNYEKKIPSGQVLTISSAELEYNGEKEWYEVTSYGQKDQGVIIMTMKLDLGLNTKGDELINFMWQTLELF